MKPVRSSHSYHRSFNLIIIFCLGICLLSLEFLVIHHSATGLTFAQAAAGDEEKIDLTQVGWLSSPEVADAPYGFPPVLDGKINPGEYAGAGKLVFPGYRGNIEAFIRTDAISLYIALDSADVSPYGNYGGGMGPAFQLFLDTNNDDAATPQLDDLLLTIRKNGNTLESHGDGSGWNGASITNWDARVYTSTWGWQAEFEISLVKLGIANQSQDSIGFALAEVWTPGWPKDNYWPAGAFYSTPSSWGELVSSSEWGDFYWKPGPWEDYAPSGVPDFDQMQFTPSWSAPTALANSLWWFDSKFEDHPMGPVGAPPGIPLNDSYTLVNTEGPLDDHDPELVPELVTKLAKYLNTDSSVPGTDIYQLYAGIQNYLRVTNTWDEYAVTLVNQPSISWIAEEVLRSEDVILLLGFWQYYDGTWHRIGGHYVTVAGVDPNPTDYLLAVSDPAQDAAEQGFAKGRILSGTLITHMPSHPDPTLNEIHNDAGNVSHDFYPVEVSTSPGGEVKLADYMPPMELLVPPGMNPNPKWEEPPVPYLPTEDIVTEIEYALAVSPFTWKASGRWVTDLAVPIYEKHFEPYTDFAMSGVPDIDQKQDGWMALGAGGIPAWTFCGPVAAANSLWWFDSKFETNGALPPLIQDYYPLVTPYGAWDDHHPLNVDDPLTPWVNPPPVLSGEMVERLAMFAATDQPPPLAGGTDYLDLANAVDLFINQAALDYGFVITQVHSPDYWWTFEEVERSEDVILLLGFYYQDYEGYSRLGGHYVTVAGVDKQGGFIAFSDPYFDRMELIYPPKEFQGTPLWTGRIGSDGDSVVGPSGLTPTYTHSVNHAAANLHNDTANVSHDIYQIAPTSSPGGDWGPHNYFTDPVDIQNFINLNDYAAPVPLAVNQPAFLPYQTEVEWLLAVSPVADVWVTKTITPTSVYPGDRVTTTIQFGNYGNLAENIVVGDVLPPGLSDDLLVGTQLNFPGTLTQTGDYTFTLTVMPYSSQTMGIITISAKVDPAYTWKEGDLVTNTVVVKTTTQEQYQLAPHPNVAWERFELIFRKIFLPLIRR